MKHFVPMKARIEKDAVIRIRRSLKGKGALYVSAGQVVTPSEIIGNATVSAGFRTLDLSALLSVPPQEVEKYLVRNLNQRIYKGELLAYKKGWVLGGKKVVTSPTDGVLDFLNTKTGELKIAFLSKKADLPAGVYGVVEVADQERGQAVIRILASRVYGVFGSGRPRDGILKLVSKKDGLVAKDMIQPKYEGYVLAGGSLFFKDAISSAISCGVSGIITGGINAGDYRGMANGRLVFPERLDNDIGISVMVCEGFGAIPLGSDIFELFKEYEGKFVSIDGNKALINLPSPSESSLIKVKNTKLPPVQNDEGIAGTEHVEKTRELWIGAPVRIAGNSYPGEQGRVAALNDSLTLLPSGLKTYLATVETPRRKIQVPVANLEMIC